MAGADGDWLTGGAGVLAHAGLEGGPVSPFLTACTWKQYSVDGCRFGTMPEFAV